MPRPFGVLVAMLLAACSPSVQSFGGPTMGSTFEVKFVGHESDVPIVREIVSEELGVFDATFSQWREDSEISRLNANPGVAPVPVSDRFAAVLRTALEVAVATGGAFDPTVKPLSDLYRAAKKRSAPLEPAAVVAARNRIGFQHVSVRVGDDGRQQLVRQRGDEQIDLDGLVAGAAADAIGALLRARGFRSFYLEITGEVLCHGRKPDGSPWRIGVVDPDSDVAGSARALSTIALQERALCTSGDYRNAVVIDGKVVHHVFDPRSGTNPDHAIVSATVLAPSCAIADAAGTAVMVLGEQECERRWPRLRALGVEGLLLLRVAQDGGWERVEFDWPRQD